MTKHTVLAIFGGDLAGEIRRTSVIQRQCITVRREDYYALIAEMPQAVRNRIADLPMNADLTITVCAELLADVRDYLRKALSVLPTEKVDEARHLLRLLNITYEVLA